MCCLVSDLGDVITVYMYLGCLYDSHKRIYNAQQIFLITIPVSDVDLG